MANSKLKKAIQSFSVAASIISPLCPIYNSESVDPFVETVHVYAENFHHMEKFLDVLRRHKSLMLGTVSICNRLFENYESQRQNTIYESSRHLFNMLNCSKQVLDETYHLAYTVGRSDSITKNLIEREKNPLVQIERRKILQDGEYEWYSKTMFNWRCNVEAIYVEERYMKHIVELCNKYVGAFKPQDARLNTCKLRSSLIIPNRSSSGTPTICELNAELYGQKNKIELHEKKKQLTVDDIDNYVRVYHMYQKELLTFVLGNFPKLYNEMCVQCLKVFLEQQHSVVFSLLLQRKKLQTEEGEKIAEMRRLNNLSWYNDIDKIDGGRGDDAVGCSSASGFCVNRQKSVGSLK